MVGPRFTSEMKKEMKSNRRLEKQTNCDMQSNQRNHSISNNRSAELQGLFKRSNAEHDNTRRGG